MLYPNVPAPSSVSAAAIIDPAHRFVSDSGFETRRVMHSRPRRRYTLEYLGKSAQDMRIIRDFLQSCRFGAGEAIQYAHSTSYDLVPALNTTPIILQYQHELVTGMWINIGTPPFVAQPWRITRVNAIQIAMDGTVASGAFTASVYNYLPYAVARFSEDTMESPTKLVGTDRLGPDRPGELIGALAGRFSWSVVIEEIF